MERWKFFQSQCRTAVSIVGLTGFFLTTSYLQAASAQRTPQEEIKLKGLRVRLGSPVQVAAQLAWQEGPEGRWAFNHTTPSMARFPTGELLVTYTMVTDYNDNPRNLSGLQFSGDGGKTWGPRHDFLAEHQPMIYVPEADGSLVAIPAYLHKQSPDDERTLVGAYTRLENGGRRVMIEPHGVRVVEWPWPMDARWGFGFFGKEPLAGLYPPQSWVALCFDGGVVKIKDKWIATAYGLRKGYSQSENLVMESNDHGRNWRYLSTIATGKDLPEKAEGPNESAMIQLADGDLMTVFRVGSGKQWNLRRAYSRDDGRSWSRAEPIPAYSVEPSLLRIRNGTLALSTGRPGIRLWLSTDPRGQEWQEIDIVEHHNRWAQDATYRIGSYEGGVHHAAATGNEQWQTSSYTEMVETAPNRILLVYDRSAKPKPENNRDLSRIFVLPIEVERD